MNTTSKFMIYVIGQGLYGGDTTMGGGQFEYHGGFCIISPESYAPEFTPKEAYKKIRRLRRIGVWQPIELRRKTTPQFSRL